MKPSKLVFCGINSFSERTEIDFEKLTANGLFGIFGETGSGKSTILDCINFALYGNVDRSKKKTDIINYNCGQAEVEYEFTLLKDGVRKKYRVERSIKKKNGLGKAMLYVAEGGDFTCIADNTTSVNAAVEEILGLNAEDFRKCIALPQGDFAQFVQCAPSERFKIVERLFSLYRYGDGLKDKISARESEIEAQYLTATGELAAYVDVTEEKIGDKERQMKKSAAELKELEKSYAFLKAQAQEMNALLNSKIQLNNARRELESQSAKSEKVEILRNLLKFAPKCASVCEVDGEMRKKRAQLLKEGELLRQKEGESNTLNLRYEALLRDAENNALAQKCEQLKIKLASFKTAEPDIRELIETDKDLRLMRDKYRTATLLCDKLRDEQFAAQKAVERVKKDIDECVVEDLEKVLEIKLKPAILRDEYTRQLVDLGELRDNLGQYGRSGELYLFIKEELTCRLKDLEEKIRALHSEKIDVEGIIKHFKEQSGRREKLLNEYNAQCETLSKRKQSCAVAETEAANLKRAGEEKKARYDKLKDKLDNIFGAGTKNYADVIRSLEEQCDAAEKERVKAEREKEQLKEDIDGLNVSIGQCTARIKALTDDCDALSSKLNRLLSESGFDSVEKCESVLNTLSGCGDVQGEISSYDAKTAALKAKIAELSAVEGVESVTAEAVGKINGELEKSEAAVREKHSECKLAESEYAGLKEAYAKKVANESNLKEISHRRELILQLKELTRGNKFLEYIAGEYLADISRSASATLLKLTCGRYFLTYEDNFYVGDNFNEGNLRGVNTLSGGETFLVSLSLALALSSAICRSSLKSIEFFFLDEGFGTLDENLIDTVMDSLEKLRSSDFTIGIISHVEELKHRIESKIIVNKATETRGSSLAVYA